MTMKEYRQRLIKEYKGKRVFYEGQIYTCVGVDWNGALLIDKKDQFKDDTAVEQNQVFKVLSFTK